MSHRPVMRGGARRGAAAAAVGCALIALVATGCASVAAPQPAASTSTATTSRTGPSAPTPVRLRGEPARAAAAVAALSGALRAGDVEGLCRPGVIFTAAVIADIESDGDSCEASDEVSALLAHPPALTVVGLAFRPDLATAQVRVGRRIIPLDILRDGRRWLISFSSGVGPLDALEA